MRHYTKWMVLLQIAFGFMINQGLAFRDDTIIEFDSYKVNHKFKDDSECLQQIISISKDKGKVRVRFGLQSYLFKETIQDMAYKGDLSLEGVKGTKFILLVPMLILTSFNKEIKLPDAIARRSRQLSGVNLPVHTALIKFNSTAIVELAWKYTANDLMAIDRFDGTTVYFKDSLNFAYQPEATSLLAYQYSRVAFKNIQIVVEKQISQVLFLKGMETVFEKCGLEYHASDQMITSINLLDNYNSKVCDFTFDGNIHYGFLINGSRNVHIKNIYSHNVEYPVAPATFTTNVLVENFFGDNSVIDAHPSFMVKYKNATTVNATDYWNCRAIGIVLENCNFQVNKDPQSQEIYLGVQTLSDAYSYLYDEYDVICKNVKWETVDKGFNGLHVHKCRDFMVDNCSTHAISTGSPIRRFEVRNSKTGRVYCGDSNFSVCNTEFIGDMQRREDIQPPLSGSYGGTINIDRCTFTGYENVELFQYLQSPDTEVNFNGCVFHDFKGFARYPLASMAEYKKIRMDNCKLNVASKRAFNLYPEIRYNE